VVGAERHFPEGKGTLKKRRGLLVTALVVTLDEVE
jgi:hypothetical protein